MPLNQSIFSADVYAPFREILNQVHYLLDPSCVDTRPPQQVAADLQVASNILVRISSLFFLFLVSFY
jgi:hypothetical protein